MHSRYKYTFVFFLLNILQFVPIVVNIKSIVMFTSSRGPLISSCSSLAIFSLNELLQPPRSLFSSSTCQFSSFLSYFVSYFMSII